MIPVLLSSLEALDVGELLRTFAGPAGGAMLSGLIVRQWAMKQINTLKKLEERARRDNARWREVERFMADQAVETERQRLNAHQLRNVVGANLFATEVIAEGCNVRVRLPTREELEGKWVTPKRSAPASLKLEEEEETEP